MSRRRRGQAPNDRSCLCAPLRLEWAVWNGHQHPPHRARHAVDHATESDDGDTMCGARHWRRAAPAANRRREAPAPRSTPSAEQPSPQKLKWTPFAPWRPPARRSRPTRAPGGRPGSRGRGRAGCGGRARPRGRAGPGKLGSHRSLGKTSKKGSNSLKHIGFGPPRERDSRYCPVQRESGHACGNTKSGGDPQSPFLPVSCLRPERGH